MAFVFCDMPDANLLAIFFPTPTSNDSFDSTPLMKESVILLPAEDTFELESLNALMNLSTADLLILLRFFPSDFRFPKSTPSDSLAKLTSDLNAVAEAVILVAFIPETDSLYFFILSPNFAILSPNELIFFDPNNVCMTPVSGRAFATSDKPFATITEFAIPSTFKPVTASPYPFRALPKSVSLVAKSPRSLPPNIN